MAQGSNKQLGPHLDVIQSITHPNLRITRKFIEDGQHTFKVKLPVDARNVPEAGYGNLTHGGNVIPREADLRRKLGRLSFTPTRRHDTYIISGAGKWR